MIRNMKLLIQALFACFAFIVQTYMALLGNVLYGVISIQLGCLITAVAVPVGCVNILLPALGFTKTKEIATEVGWYIKRVCASVAGH